MIKKLLAAMRKTHAKHSVLAHTKVSSILDSIFNALWSLIEGHQPNLVAGVENGMDLSIFLI